MDEGEIMEKSYYCPDCSHKLEMMSGCGSTSYFCHKCKTVISKKKIFSEEQIVLRIVHKVIEQLSVYIAPGK